MLPDLVPPVDTDPLATFRCVVVVEGALADGPAAGQQPHQLVIIWANGDESAAQGEAEKWCLKNPGRRAWVMSATGASPCVAETKTKWRQV